jgi:hypothetical protein
MAVRRLLERLHEPDWPQVDITPAGGEDTVAVRGEDLSVGDHLLEGGRRGEVVPGQQRLVIDHPRGAHIADRCRVVLVAEFERAERPWLEARRCHRAAQRSELAVLVHERDVLTVGQQHVDLGMTDDGRLVRLHEVRRGVGDDADLDVVRLFERGVDRVVGAGVGRVRAVHEERRARACVAACPASG